LINLINITSYGLNLVNSQKLAYLIKIQYMVKEVTLRSRAWGIAMGTTMETLGSESVVWSGWCYVDGPEAALGLGTH
jgi:hypothetical protein